MVQFTLANISQVSAFGVEFSQQSITIFITASLIGTVWVGKVEFD